MFFRQGVCIILSQPEADHQGEQAETPAPLKSSSQEGSDDDSVFDPQADDSPENRRRGQGQVRRQIARGRERGRARDRGRGRGRGHVQAVPPAAGNTY